MKVAGDNNDCVESQMPVFRSASTAPKRKTRYTRQRREIFTQREVIDQHRGQIISERLQATFCPFAASAAPFNDPRIGVWMEKHLVGTDNSRFASPLERTLNRHVPWPEAVIVKQE